MKKFKQLAAVSSFAIAVVLGGVPVGASQFNMSATIDISQQPLSTALQDLSHEYGIQIASFSEDIIGKRTVEVTGRYTLAKALSAVLKGSDLRFVQVDDRTVAVGTLDRLTKQYASSSIQAASFVTSAGYEAGLAVAAEDERMDALDADDTVEFEEIVVVVGRTTNIDVDSDDIAKLQASDLSDLFRSTPSISVGGVAGLAQKIYIRGLEDTLLNITVDGAPQTGTLFHHIGRVNVEPELLEQVSVQAGAGEATAGFGAIGGSVRFKTKTANDLLEDGDTFGGMAKAGYFSNNAYKLSMSLYGKITEKWGVLGSYVYVDRKNMDDGGGNPIFGTSAEQGLAFIKVSGDITEDQRLTLSYEQRDENGELCQRPNWYCPDTGPFYPIEAKRQTAVANYTNSLSDFVNLELSAYYTHGTVLQNGRFGPYEANLKTYGFDFRNVSDLDSHTLTYGIEYRHDDVAGLILASPPGSEEVGSLLGIYFQDHFTVSDALVLSFGARYDRYKLEMLTSGEETDSSDFSFNIGFDYEITTGLNFTAGYAQAARGKEVSDGFTLFQRGDRLAPNLKSENAVNWEAALVYENGGLHASATYYNSKIKDVIYDQLFGAPYFENIGDYNADGWELKLAYTADTWYFTSFFTSYNSDLNGHPLNGYEYNGLAGTDGERLTANIAYTPSENLEIGWRIAHTFELEDIEVFHRVMELGFWPSLASIDKPGYTLNDIYIQWMPFDDDRLRVNLTANNIFDVLYRDHATVGDFSHLFAIVQGSYSPGRDIRLSATYKF